MNYIKFVSLNAEHIIDNPEHEVINMYMHIQIKLLVTTLLGEKIRIIPPWIIYTPVIFKLSS